MKPVALTVFRCVLVAAALVGAYYSALFARASWLFHEDTAASVAAAVRLVPFNGAYIARLAGWEPDNKVSLLHRAVELNPFDVQSWIQLGLTAEIEQHDIASAERYYLRAAQVDHMFLPKWTLTNFYFRQQKANDFFRWAKATLEITPYAADPVFAQMWLMSQDPRRIARAIPDRGGVLLAYASFLANAHQYQSVAPIVNRLVAAAGHGNPADYGRDDQIGPIEDRMLAAGYLQPALDIWRSMRQANWVNLPAPTREHPLNNGHFEVAFFGHGFDWAPISSTGVTIDQFPSDRNVRLTLSGIEPEHCVLLRQYVPLEPNRAYRLTWQAEGHEIDLPSGLAWHLHAASGYPTHNQGHFSLATGDLLKTPSGTWDFQSPGTDLYLFTLEYTRPLGSMRATGTVTLQAVSVQEQ